MSSPQQTSTSAAKLVAKPIELKKPNNDKITTDYIHRLHLVARHNQNRAEYPDGTSLAKITFVEAFPDDDVVITFFHDDIDSITPDNGANVSVSGNTVTFTPDNDAAYQRVLTVQVSKPGASPTTLSLTVKVNPAGGGD